jgi:hypothetical protein
MSRSTNYLCLLPGLSLGLGTSSLAVTIMDLGDAPGVKQGGRPFICTDEGLDAPVKSLHGGQGGCRYNSKRILGSVVWRD